MGLDKAFQRKKDGLCKYDTCRTFNNAHIYWNNDLYKINDEKMRIVVQKYGGTSVGSVEKIKSVAKRIVDRKKSGDDIIVVVSAMQHTTDELIALAKKINPNPPERELDMLLTAGERVAMTLLAMAIWKEGVEAISLTGSQSGIITEDNHTRARIVEIRPARIMEELAKGRIVIVAGFQGVSGKKEVTTLGRGGSDTTAVALAASLGATICEIYTDVPGVFSSDPAIVPDAHKLEKISYDEMLEFAYFGATVIHPRAVEIARRYKIPLLIALSDEDEKGTIIKEDNRMEEIEIKGITKKEILLIRFPFEHPEEFENIFNEIVKLRIPIDFFSIEENVDKRIANFVVDRSEKVSVASIPNIVVFDDFSVIGIIGYGIAGRADLVLEVIMKLRAIGIEPLLFSQRHTSIAFLVPSSVADDIVRILSRDFITKRKKYGKI